MGNRTTFMPLGLLLMGVCMYACMHVCVSELPEPDAAGSQQWMIVFSCEIPSDMTERDVRNLLKRNRLADAEDIQQIKIIRELRLVTITLFDPRVAAMVARRWKINYNGRILHIMPKRPIRFETDDIFDS
jgi:hypothetical protein